MTLYKIKNKAELKKLVNDNSVDLKDLDISAVTDMSNLFRNCKRDDYSGLKYWDMSKVQNIKNLFCGSNFNIYSADLSHWDLDSLPNKCKSFNYLYSNVFLDTPFHLWFKNKFDLFKKSSKGEDYFNVVNLESPEYFADLDLPSEQKIKLPLKSQYVASPYIKGELLNEFIDSHLNRLDEIDVSCVKDFSNVLAASNRGNYEGIENWQTPNALCFNNFAKGAVNFNVCLNHFDFSNCAYLTGFLSETDYNHPLKFNLNFNKLKDCSFMLADCDSFNNTFDCFVADQDVSAYTFNAFGAFSYCTALNSDKLPNYRKVAPNLATAISDGILSSKIRLRYKNDLLDEYNDLIEDLNHNPNFCDPIFNHMVVICKDQNAQDKLQEVVNLKNHFDGKKSFDYAIQPLSAFSESLEESPCFEIQGKLYQELTRDLENSDLFTNDKKGNAIQVVDKEYVDKNYVFLSVRDYVTLSCFYWDHCRENNYTDDFEPDFESLKIFDKYKFQSTKSSFNSLLNIMNKLKLNQTEYLTEQELKTYNVLRTICEHGLINLNDKQLDKELAIVKDQNLIPKISKRSR